MMKYQNIIDRVEEIKAKYGTEVVNVVAAKILADVSTILDEFPPRFEKSGHINFSEVLSRFTYEEMLLIIAYACTPGEISAGYLDSAIAQVENRQV